MSQPTPSRYSQRTKRVLEVIASSDHALTVPELVASTGLERHILSTTLTRLIRYGLIERTDHGVYLPRSSASQSPSIQSTQPCVCRCCDH